METCEGDNAGTARSEAAPTAAAEAGPAAASAKATPGWQALLAPWAAIVRPSVGARWLLGASRPAFLAAVLAALTFLASVLVALFLWSDTLRLVWSPAAGSPPTGPGGYPLVPSGGFTELRSRTVAEVWQGWHANTPYAWLSPAEITLILVFILGSLLILFLGWLNLPFVHRADSAARSYWRSVRASASVLVPLALAIGLAGALLIAVRHAHLRGGSWSIGPADSELLVYCALPVLAWLVVIWQSLLLNSAATSTPQPAPAPPRCEGCGYDLTHVPDSGRCTECGLKTAASLTPGFRRRGSPWAREMSIASWLATSLAVIFRPRAFYEALQSRTPPAVETRYVAWTCAALLVGTWGCGLGLLVVGSARHGSPGAELPLICMLAALGLLAVAAGWAVNRAAAALALTGWLWRRELPDFAVVRKINAYEASFLWVFLACLSAFIGSFIIFEDWISQLVGWSRFGAPLEFLVVLAVLLLLGITWLVRYEIAYRALRWANF